MGTFDENKIMWTSQECMAGAAADRIYERIAVFLGEEEPSKAKVLALAVHLVADNASRMDFVTTVAFLFAGNSLKKFLDRAKDLACMLERDNDWFDED